MLVICKESFFLNSEKERLDWAEEGEQFFDVSRQLHC